MFDVPTQYCERIVGQLSFEPINIISSVAYLVVAVIAYWYLRKRGHTSPVLPVLLGLIGLGSMWWHITASPLGDIADTLSIAVFASVAAFMLLQAILRSKLAIGGAFLFLLAAILFTESSDVLNGSLPYIVLLAGFVVAGTFYAQKFPSSKFLVVSAVLTFLSAILFRSIDLSVCSYLPIGTHFLWHILVAAFGLQLLMLLSNRYR